MKSYKIACVPGDGIGNEVVPESLFEKELYRGALRRRQLRLVLAKRMEPKNALELKSLFMD